MKKRLLPILLTVALIAGCGATGLSANKGDNNEAAAEISVEAASEVASEASLEATVEAIVEATLEATTEATVEATVEASKDSTTEATAKASADASSGASAEASKEKKAEAATEATTQAAAEEVIVFDDSAPAPQPLDYGRIIFTGDSRTVDMFYGDRGEIWGEYHDGIPVYCRDACQSDYMINAINSFGMDNFDTLVTWMGCNDYGNFSPYESYYNTLLAQGKNIVVCTVGPTDNNTLANDFDREYYTNERQVAFNNSLVSWANSNGVKVIDLYSYIAGNGNLYINPADGIHYMPQPTTEIWNYILSCLR
ncbi:MAG: hypothetical protein IJI01_14485 [Butyrivibrio sp.]|uniref:SGNH/GDSL hydrolase family protein n=1 Tax=Butyrivibrio sp. TaxID=28121 RepID=UPI0025BE5A79|nr:SGNH/GDSL hydrolase family protein [Butyrivibrio sp.]MBQ6589868.1 hypothetical protein [Butyrivibrio sp.]